MMRPFPVLFCVCALLALQGCASGQAPTQSRFDEGTAAYDEGHYKRAYKIFRELADENDIAALRNVALMERKGLGTDKDPQAALNDYLEAANDGLPTAQADLAEMYLNGEAGPPDPKAALPWLERAVAANHPMAQFHLAQLYEQGEVVPKDMHMAEFLYAAAAAHGVQAATERLSALKGFPQPGTPEATPPPDPPQIPIPRPRPPYHPHH
jgi:TPR repeat protein